MELSDFVKNFVLKEENIDVLVNVARLSTEYLHNYIFDKDYHKTLEKLKAYLNEREEFKDVDVGQFSLELVKYLYEHRAK